MFKARSRSMQRGTQVRDGDSSGPVSAYEGIVPIFSTADEPHFEHGSISREVLAVRLQPAVVSLAKNGFRKPAEVAPLLNRFGFTTACGAPWTPRLVWFLLKEIFGREGEQIKSHGSARPPGQIPFPTGLESKLIPAKRLEPKVPEWTSAIVVVESKLSDELLAPSMDRLNAVNVVYVFGSSRAAQHISKLLPKPRVVAVKNTANRDMILENSAIIIQI